MVYSKYLTLPFTPIRNSFFFFNFAKFIIIIPRYSVYKLCHFLINFVNESKIKRLMNDKFKS